MDYLSLEHLSLWTPKSYEVTTEIKLLWQNVCVVLFISEDFKDKKTWKKFDFCDEVFVWLPLEVKGLRNGL